MLATCLLLRFEREGHGMSDRAMAERGKSRERKERDEGMGEQRTH